ncbi:50S ribosomal protein L7/L12 [Candidatus Saccharibacteria bacterium]|nr:50S ribosomal protein L7/L12 [Candidatus Saccharibacteria bacterium]
MNKEGSKVDLKKLAEQLVNLSVLEVNDLNQILKEEHGIEPAAAPVAAAAPQAGAGGEEAQAGEKDKFDVLLKDPGAQKVAVIKAVKDLTDMPLSEAKALVDGAPKNVKEGVDKEEAGEMKSKLEEAGATVELV